MYQIPIQYFFHQRLLRSHSLRAEEEKSIISFKNREEVRKEANQKISINSQHQFSFFLSRSILSDNSH